MISHTVYIHFSPGSVVVEFLMTFTVHANVVLKTEIVLGVIKGAASSGRFGDDLGALNITDIVVERKCFIITGYNPSVTGCGSQRRHEVTLTQRKLM